MVGLSHEAARSLVLVGTPLLAAFGALEDSVTRCDRGVDCACLLSHIVHNQKRCAALRAFLSIVHDFFGAGMTILDTVIVSPFISPVSLTV
jgi:hypothetical protein